MKTDAEKRGCGGGWRGQLGEEGKETSGAEQEGPQHPQRTRARGPGRDWPPPLTPETRATPRGSGPSTEQAGAAPGQAAARPSEPPHPCPPGCLAAQPWLSSDCRSLHHLLVAAASHGHPGLQPAPWSVTVPALLASKSQRNPRVNQESPPVA